MTEKILIASAKKPDELDATYAKVKTDAKDYGFSAVAALKEESISAAMTEKKKAADFVVEVDVSGKAMIAQLVCEVKDGMRSVLGRKEIKTVAEFKHAVKLAKNQHLNNVAKDLLI